MTIVHRERCREEWIDYNGHMSEAYYVLVFGHATDRVLEEIGMDPAHREATGTSVYTSEAHLRYLGQVEAGEELVVRSSLVGASDKVIHLWHELSADGGVRATEEVLGLHVDVPSGRVTAFAEAQVRRIEELLVDPPPDAGRAIAVRRR